LNVSEIVPAADLIALLVNPANFASEAEAEEPAAAARALGVRLLVINATNPAEIEGAFSKLVGAGAGALLVSVDPLFFTLRHEIIALAARYVVPASYLDREAVASGGLMKVFIPPAPRRGHLCLDGTPILIEGGSEPVALYFRAKCACQCSSTTWRVWRLSLVQVQPR
jgi:hypothetical protein